MINNTIRGHAQKIWAEMCHLGMLLHFYLYLVAGNAFS